jgi:septal ring-binding cell division protein DamX
MRLGSKRGGGGGDMVLESRHVIGIFLLMVVISGVVFTLGYVLGRSQYYTQVRAATSSTKALARPEPEPVATKPAETSASSQPAPAGLPAPSDLDFYRAAEPKKADQLQKPAKAVAAAGKPAAPAPSSPRPAAAKTKVLLNAPLIPRGAILLQVAALTREDDALALAEALQRKKFPAFVLTPGPDHYYRVQVGPYADAQSAAIAKKALDHEGFKAITRR